jgi:hypothetical protein
MRILDIIPTYEQKRRAQRRCQRRVESIGSNRIRSAVVRRANVPIAGRDEDGLAENLRGISPSAIFCLANSDSKEASFAAVHPAVAPGMLRQRSAETMISGSPVGVTAGVMLAEMVGESGGTWVQWRHTNR